MKKNKILIGVISIIFAGIITLGIIECKKVEWIGCHL